MEQIGNKKPCPICNNQIANELYDRHIPECLIRNEEQSGNLQNLINQSQQLYQQQQQQENQNSQQNQRDQLDMNEKAQCPNCGEMVPFSQLHIHEENCQNKESPCEYCGEQFPRDLMESHLEFCPEKRNIQLNRLFYQQVQVEREQEQQQQERRQQQQRQEQQRQRQPSNPMDIFNIMIQNMSQNIERREQQQQQQQQQQRQQQQQQQQQQRRTQTHVFSIFDLLGLSNRQNNRNNQQQQNNIGGQPQVIQMLSHLLQHNSLENYDYSNNGGMQSEQLKEFPVSKYQKKQNQQQQDSCAICMSEYEQDEEVKHLDCLHTYHSECIDKWLEKNSTCPVCKTDMRQ